MGSGPPFGFRPPVGSGAPLWAPPPVGSGPPCGPYAVGPGFSHQVILFKFHPLEIVSRFRDPQLQVDRNYSQISMFSSRLIKRVSINSGHVK